MDNNELERFGTSTLGEEWRNAPEFGPYYIVSSFGRVRNVDTGKLLSGEIDRDGYRRVNLRRGDRSFKRRVHRLVCGAFHGPQPVGCEVCHRDGNRLNNRATNLMWGTRSDNVQHSIEHGTHRYVPPHVRRPGASNSQAKFTQEQVAAMRDARAAGKSERAIAAEFGCSASTAHFIVKGDRYAA